MNRFGLFRTPIAIGMLCGALTGSVGLLVLAIKPYKALGPEWTALYFLALELLQLNLLIALPARLIRGHWGSLFRVELTLIALLFVASVLPYFLMHHIWSLLGDSFRYFWFAWRILYFVAAGALLGRTLAGAFDLLDLRRAGMAWGAVGSSGRVLLVVGSAVIGKTDTEGAAAFGMLAAIAFIVQGAVAAVPFERMRRREASA